MSSGVPPRSSAPLYALVAGAALGSAALGFVREAAIGALFGASETTDAYYAALTIPFLGAYFLVGGALAPPLTVALAGALSRADADAARRLLRRSLGLVAAAGAGAGALIGLLAPAIARILVPGFTEAQMELAAQLLRILVGYGFLVSLGILLSAALNAAGAHRTPALATLAQNAVSVALLFRLREMGVSGAAWAMAAGGLTLVVAQLPRLLRLDLLRAPEPTPAPRHSAGALRPPHPPEQGAPARRSSPPRLPWGDSGLLLVALLASAAVDVAERSFASSAGVGAITLLAFASKLLHLPMRLLAAPVAAIALPRLTRDAERRLDPATETGRVTGFVLLSLLFAATVTAGAAGPLVTLTFRRGRFDAGDAAALANVLLILAPAVLAVGIIELGGKLLLSGGGARSVAIAQAAGLLAYLASAPFLVERGAAGLAVARDLSWGLVATLLLVPLVRRHRLSLPGSALAWGLAAAVAVLAAGVTAKSLEGSALLRTVAATASAGAFFLGIGVLATRRLRPAAT